MTDSASDRLNAALEGRYKIERQLGEDMRRGALAVGAPTNHVQEVTGRPPTQVFGANCGCESNVLVA